MAPAAGAQDADHGEGAGVLARAESLLVNGDTAGAIALLTGGRPIWLDLSDAAVGAQFALQWIGRAPGREDARRTWLRQVADLASAGPHDVRVELLRWSSALEHRAWGQGGIRPYENRTATQQVGYRALDEARWGSHRPLLAGAGRWLLAQDALVAIDEYLVAAIPRHRDLVQSGGRFVQPPEARSHREIVTGDSTLASELDEARLHLYSALGTAWPFSEMAGRTLVGVEALFGTPDSRMGLLDSLAHSPSLAERPRIELAAVLLDLSERREVAESLMAAWPAWFAPLDTAVSSLGVGPDLPPPVLWRISWPLYLEPTNERLTVHRTRLLLADALIRTIPARRSPFGLEDLRVAFVRHGIPAGITAQPRGTNANDVTVLSYLDRRTVETVVRRGGAGSDELSLDLALAARDPASLRGPSGYVDRHFDALEFFEHQVVHFVRDGRPQVQVHSERPEPRCEGPAPELGFFLLDERLGLTRATRDSIAPAAPRRRTFGLPIDPGQYVYSIEVLDQACRQAARARFALEVRAPAAGLGLSDVMLVDTSALLVPERIPGLPAAQVRPGLTVRPDEPMHFYWEVYGVAATAVEEERLEVDFDVVDAGRKKVPVRELSNFARRVGRAGPAVSLSYGATVPPGREPLGMTLTVGLEGAHDGVHVVRIRVRDGRTGATAEAERAIYVMAGS